jgi:N-acetylneuraminic acid mutarotase
VHIVAAWHGPYPAGERQINHTIIYNPYNDSFREGCQIPVEYARGAAGCVVYKDIFYIINGAVDGHVKKDGAYAYRNFTRFNPATCEWANLPAQPQYNRDHFEAVLSGSTIILTAGRDSPHGDNVFQYTTAPVEHFDLDQYADYDDANTTSASLSWRVGANITTQRAGANSIVDEQGRVVVIGGEAINQPDNKALTKVERYDPKTDEWTALPSMQVGRHTSGRMLYTDGKGGQMLIATAGVGKMGGEPLLTDTEALSSYHNDA